MDWRPHGPARSGESSSSKTLSGCPPGCRREKVSIRSWREIERNQGLLKLQEYEKRRTSSQASRRPAATRAFPGIRKKPGRYARNPRGNQTGIYSAQTAKQNGAPESYHRDHRKEVR